jgi:hypothetical protein
VENALAYTPAGGSAALRLAAREGRAEIVVEDTGIGIAPEEQERIFEPFYRVDRSRGRNGNGVGFGLSIVRYLVEAHGGSVALESTPSVGSRFTVSLPLAPHPLPSPPPASWTRDGTRDGSRNAGDGGGRVNQGVGITDYRLACPPSNRSSGDVQRSGAMRATPHGAGRSIVAGGDEPPAAGAEAAGDAIGAARVLDPIPTRQGAGVAAGLFAALLGAMRPEHGGSPYFL